MGGVSGHLGTAGTNGPERYGSMAVLHPDRREEYVMLHAHVWPDVEKILHSHGIRNHSIFISGNLLFRYYEFVGDDHDRAMRQIEQCPAIIRWNEVTSRCQVPHEVGDFSVIWELLPSICFLE